MVAAISRGCVDLGVEFAVVVGIKKSLKLTFVQGSSNLYVESES